MKIPLTLASKLPTAKTSRSKAGGMGKRSPTNVPLMDATARATSTAGRVATDIAQRMYVAEGQRETLQAYNDMNDGFNVALDEIKKPEHQNMSVTEHEDWFKSQSNNLKTNVLGKMKNYKAKQAMSAKFDMTSSNELVKTQAVGWNREVDNGRKTLYSALDTFSNEASKGNFSAIGDAEAAIKGAIKSGHISKEQGEVALDKFNNDTTMSYWKRQSDDFQETTFDQVFSKSRNKKGFPVRGKKGLWNVKRTLPESFKNFDEEQKRNTLNYIKKGWESYWSRLSWGKRKSKLVLNDDMKNDLAFIKATGKGDPEIEAKIKFAYGDDPDLMEQVLEIHDRNQTLATVSNDWTDKLMKSSPAEEAAIADNISRYTEGGGTVTKGYKLDPQNPEANRLVNDPDVQKLSGWRRAQFIATMEGVRYKKSQALAKDPVAFVNKFYGDELNSLPPEDRPNFLIAEQLRLGVQPHNVSILTEGQAENVVGKLNAMTGEQKVNEIISLQQSLPTEQFRIAYRDLVKQDLPTGTMFLISQDHPSQALVRQSYAKVLDMKEADLKNALGDRASDVNKEFNSAFDKAFSNYTLSIANQGGGEMDTQRLNGVRTVIKKTVMNDAKDDSLDVGDLTEHYVNKSFNDMFNYQKGYRIPKLHNPDNVDYYTNFLEGTLGDFPILTPGSMDSSLDADYLRRTYLDNIRTNGKWVNSPDGRGLVLLDSNSQPVVYSKSPGDIQPFVIPFGLADELGGEIIAGVNATSEEFGATAEGVAKELERITAPIVNITESITAAGIKRDKAVDKNIEGVSKIAEYMMRGGRGLY